MHGKIFIELYHFYNHKKKLGNAIPNWYNILQKAGLNHYQFSPIKVYPDEELLKIVQTISKEASIDIPVLLEDFGRYIIHSLLNHYSFLLKPEWKSIDLLENVNQIHQFLKADSPDFTPPNLPVKRLNENHFEITYNSKRKLCIFAKGLIKGVGEFYHEQLHIEEPKCMHKGDEFCLLKIHKI